MASPEKVTAKRGEAMEVKTPVTLKPGYHANSDKPSEPYLIPMKLTWESGLVETVAVVFPKPTLEKYQFSEKPLSVFTGAFELVTKFKVSPNAANGPGMVLGKLRYQACNDTSCLPPRTVEVKLPVVIQ